MWKMGKREIQHPLKNAYISKQEFAQGRKAIKRLPHKAGNLKPLLSEECIKNS